MPPLPDHLTKWYYAGSISDIFRVRAFGNLKFHTVMGLLYLMLTVVVPFGVVSAHKTETSQWAVKHIEGIMVWLLLVMIALPLFVWLERNSFERWLEEHAIVPSKPHRDRFEINARHVESFWKIVGTLYVTAGIFSFQLKPAAPATPDAPGKAEFESLTAAVKELAAAQQALVSSREGL